jgi:hypothetical protein
LLRYGPRPWLKQVSSLDGNFLSDFDQQSTLSLIFTPAPRIAAKDQLLFEICHN